MCTLQHVLLAVGGFDKLSTSVLVCLYLRGCCCRRLQLGGLPQQLKEALDTSPVAVHLAVGLLHKAVDVGLRYCQLGAVCKHEGHLHA